MHQAIKDNIEYWSRQVQALMEIAPFHTSYYCVDEGGQLKVYGVKWNGADLNKCQLFVPENHDELLADARAAIAKGNAIGDILDMGGGPYRQVDSYVFNSPVHMITRWQESHAGSLLRRQEIEPQTYKFKVNKQTHSVRFADETEDSVTVLVEPR
jgi:hypothetical protein